MSYKVKLDVFEGPFDLLVYLIEKAEMSIYDIQVSVITAQYLAHIEKMRAEDLVIDSEFMVLAAILIELKSKMLLPGAEPAAAVDEEDPREELTRKLVEYRRFKLAAGLLGEIEEDNRAVLEKPGEDLQAFTGEPDEYLRMDLKKFLQSFRMFLGRKQRIDEIRRGYTRVARQRATVESGITYIRELFERRNVKILTFRELLTPESDRRQVTLTFVSLLEMMRANEIYVSQEVIFGEIVIRAGKFRAGAAYAAEPPAGKDGLAGKAGEKRSGRVQ
ncbi:MAG: segregation/condensation protein A [Clostridiales Family XIII bacterium]|jgi:segregation and condensation protein A|nr:segregation/condensation protein A [Clostridiales Family XIII bacterium]